MTGNQPRKPGRCDHGLKPSVLARMIWLMHAINKREIAHGIGRSLLVRHVLLRLSNPLREGGCARHRTGRAEAALVEQSGRSVLLMETKMKLLRANLTVTRWRPNPFVITRSSKKGMFPSLGRYRSLRDRPKAIRPRECASIHSFVRREEPDATL